MSTLSVSQRVAATGLAVARHADRVPRESFEGPLFLLATPRGFSSVISTMLGQHPQMYGLPETHLFTDELMRDWWQRADRESFDMAHGLLRAVGQICFGEQTEHTVELATGWLRRRDGYSSGLILEELASAVSPLRVIEKSPSLVYSLDAMQRAYRFFPEARFLHLVRHPRGYCHSVLRYLELLGRPEYQPADAPRSGGEAPAWITNLAHFPYPQAGDGGEEGAAPLDPQGGWYVLHSRVIEFLKSVPADRQMTVRGEDLLGDPHGELAAVASWLGLRIDPAAIEEMKHPENSPFAGFGPKGARLGNDILFLERPTLRRRAAEGISLDGPLSWRGDAAGFRPEVIELAGRFGYA